MGKIPIETATANNTTVFTMAYGADAGQKILTELADQANGNFYLGNEPNIAAIYQELSSRFRRKRRDWPVEWRCLTSAFWLL